MKDRHCIHEKEPVVFNGPTNRVESRVAALGRTSCVDGNSWLFCFLQGFGVANMGGLNVLSM